MHNKVRIRVPCANGQLIEWWDELSCCRDELSLWWDGLSQTKTVSVFRKSLTVLAKSLTVFSSLQLTHKQEQLSRWCLQLSCEQKQLTRKHLIAWNEMKAKWNVRAHRAPPRTAYLSASPPCQWNVTAFYFTTTFLPPTMLMPLLGSIIFQSCIIWDIKTHQ